MSEMQYDLIREKEMKRATAVWEIETFDRHFELLWPLINTINSDYIRASIIAFGQDFSSVMNGCRHCLYRFALQSGFVTAEACCGYDSALWQRNYECRRETFQKIISVHTHPKTKAHRTAVRCCVQDNVEKVFGCKMDGDFFTISKDGYDIETCFDDHRSSIDISFSHAIRTGNVPKVSIHSSVLRWIGQSTQIEWEVAKSQQEIELMVSQAIELGQIFLEEYPWGLDKLSSSK